MDKYQIDKTKDALFRGEFEVVKELIAAFEDGEASKRECDKVIDKNGPAPKVINNTISVESITVL